MEGRNARAEQSSTIPERALVLRGLKTAVGPPLPAELPPSPRREHGRRAQVCWGAYRRSSIRAEKRLNFDEIASALDHDFRASGFNICRRRGSS